MGCTASRAVPSGTLDLVLPVKSRSGSLESKPVLKPRLATSERALSPSSFGGAKTGDSDSLRGWAQSRRDKELMVTTKSGRAASSGGAAPVTVVANPLLSSHSSRAFAPAQTGSTPLASNSRSLSSTRNLRGDSGVSWGLGSPGGAYSATTGGRHIRSGTSGAGFTLNPPPSGGRSGATLGFGSRIVHAAPRVSLQALAAIETLVLSRVGLGGASQHQCSTQAHVTTNPMHLHRSGRSDGDILAHSSHHHHHTAAVPSEGHQPSLSYAASSSSSTRGRRRAKTSISGGTNNEQLKATPVIVPTRLSNELSSRPTASIAGATRVPSLRLATITSYSTSESRSGGTRSSDGGSTTANSEVLLNTASTSSMLPLPLLPSSPTTSHLEHQDRSEDDALPCDPPPTDNYNNTQASVLAQLAQREAARSSCLSGPPSLACEPRGQLTLLPSLSPGEAGLALQLDDLAAGAFTLPPSPCPPLATPSDTSEEAQTALITASTARFNVLCEVLATEHAYVADLQALVKLFVRPLEEDAAAAAATAYGGRSGGSTGVVDVSPELILPPSLIPLIFCNVCELLDAHAWLLRTWWEGYRALAHAVDEATSCGDATLPSSARYDILLQGFSQVAPVLRRLHATYCCGYETAAATAHAEEAKGGLFAGFIAFNRLKPEARGKDLHSLLIAPVQRLCRYPLLFKTLATKAVASSTTTHPAQRTLQTLVAVAERLAADVNADVTVAQAAKRRSGPVAGLGQTDTRTATPSGVAL